MKYFVAAIVLISCLPSHSKTIVCAITINSDNEINAFKNRFAKNDFEFIELTSPELSAPPINPDRGEQAIFIHQGWFKNACTNLSKITNRCDVLVVSGHYEDAGAFNGDTIKYFNSPVYAEQEQMEYYSCSKKCSPLFQNVKEVYLFGCRTLGTTGVAPNSGNPYLSRLAKNTKLRMRMTFPNAYNIFGFRGYSPLGESIEGSLVQYLKKRTPDSFSSSASAYDNSNLWRSHFSYLGRDEHGTTRIENTRGISFLDSDETTEQRSYNEQLYDRYCDETVRSYNGLDLKK